jgi:hypothetical protein
MNEFKKSKEILDGVEKTKISEEIVGGRLCDRAFAEDVLALRRGQYEERRKVLLDSIVKNRVCPSCRRRLYSDNSWVINKDSHTAICRSCFSAKEAIRGGGVVGGFISGGPIVRIPINGWKIMQLRSKAGVGIKAFSRKMKWCTAYQYQIENGDYDSLKLETVEKIIKGLEEIGVCITDSI